MQFTPKQVVLTDLFAKDMVYVIPSYQRPYSWDCIGKSDKNNQVNVMWQDLIESYESGSSDIYFLGSMVLIGKDVEREYEVVDGQQRLTTLTILLVAIKCFLQKMKDDNVLQTDKYVELESFVKKAIEEIDSLIFNKTIFGLVEQDKKVKIARGATGFDYDTVLKEVMNCGSKTSLVLTNATPEQLEVTDRFFKNLHYLRDRIKEKFTEKGIFTYELAGQLNKFVEFLKRKVTVVQILAPSFEVAYQIFEILNNRGLPLSNKDLFRNFLISEFQSLKQTNPQASTLDPNEKWSTLDDNYNLDTEFISRYVESKNAKNQKFSAFNDLQEIYKGVQPTLIKSKIEVFYDDLTVYLNLYTKITKYNFENESIRSSVQFILNAGNTGYSLNLLLSLFRNTDDEAKQIDFLKAYERYTSLMLLAPASRFSSKPIYKAIGLLNTNQYSLAIAEFDLKPNEETNLRKYISEPIKDNDLAKLFISKFLWSSMSDDVVEQKLIYDKATLEHIIPQNPDSSTNWLSSFSTQFRNDYTYRLGNMTLLTTKMNSSARNFDFSRKKLTYNQTILAMTKSIGEKDTIDESFIEDRHKIIVEKLIEAFGL